MKIAFATAALPDTGTAVVLAADTRLLVGPDVPLLLALPARDVLPVTEAMVAALRRSAEIAAVEGDWRR